MQAHWYDRFLESNNRDETLSSHALPGPIAVLFAGHIDETPKKYTNSMCGLTVTMVGMLPLIESPMRCRTVASLQHWKKGYVSVGRCNFACSIPLADTASSSVAASPEMAMRERRADK